MENSGVLASWFEWFVRRRTAIKLSLLWLAVLAAFGAYGFLGEGQSDGRTYGTEFDLRGALQGMLIFGALGLAVATCLTTGILLLAKVRRSRLEKGWAILLLAAMPVPCALLTFLILQTLRAAIPWFLKEEQATLTVLGVSCWSLEGSALGCATVALLVMTAKTRPSNLVNSHRIFSIRSPKSESSELRKG
jgi:hypothetical protein